jgi:hypothetical protein
MSHETETDGQTVDIGKIYRKILAIPQEDA